MKKGDFTNPSFVLTCGTEIKLKRIKAVIVNAMQSEYRRKHPIPAPPYYKAENGEWFQDTTNPEFQALLENWEAVYNHTFACWMWQNGVASQPPKDYKPEYELHPDPKVNWLLNILEDEDTLPLVKAIMGIDAPTAEGLEDAEKK